MSVPGNRTTHYQNLRDRYTNCTYVDGNLELTWLQDDSLDLSFLKYIREVSSTTVGPSLSPVRQKVQSQSCMGTRLTSVCSIISHASLNRRDRRSPSALSSSSRSDRLVSANLPGLRISFEENCVTPAECIQSSHTCSKEQATTAVGQERGTFRLVPIRGAYVTICFRLFRSTSPAKSLLTYRLPSDSHVFQRPNRYKRPAYFAYDATRPFRRLYDARQAGLHHIPSEI